MQSDNFGRVAKRLKRGPAELLRQLQPEEIAEHRNFNCRDYERCMYLAAKKNWMSFSCRQCFTWNIKKRESIIYSCAGDWAYYSENCTPHRAEIEKLFEESEEIWEWILLNQNIYSKPSHVPLPQEPLDEDI